MKFLYENVGLNREQRRAGLKENRKLMKNLLKVTNIPYVRPV